MAIAFSAALIALGGCAAGVDYGPYIGSYYTGAYALPGYAYGYPYGAVGLRGIWIGDGRGDWHRWRGFHGHQHWGAWRVAPLMLQAHGLVEDIGPATPGTADAEAARC